MASFPSNTSLSNARMVVSQSGKEDVSLTIANQALAANTYYSFQRNTFMQNYFTLETTEDNTQVKFNYADVQDGFLFQSGFGYL